MVSIIALLLLTVLLTVASILVLSRYVPSVAKKIVDVKEPAMLMIFIVIMFVISFTLTIVFSDFFEGIFPY